MGVGYMEILCIIFPSYYGGCRGWCDNRGDTGISPRVQRPENQKLWCPRAKENGCLSSRRGRKFVLSALLFYSAPHKIGWCPLTLGGEWISLISLLVQMLISSGNILSPTYPEIIFYQLCRYPWAQLSWYIKITIMLFLRYNNNTLTLSGDSRYS